MSKKHILFVDDEPQILEGLRNRLRRQRSKWDMTFVDGGERALELIRSQPFDVIVSDMRMPQMDGATLLRRVQEERPEMVRVVLSGHAELETALRAVPVAHQFLSKPCDVGLLENVVERACNLQRLINDDVVRSIVGKVESLPSVPRVYSQLVSALGDERTEVEDVARILSQDMAMCAKVLQIANSAFFRLPRSISKVKEAVIYLGFTTIKQVLLTAEVFSMAAGRPSCKGLSLDRLQQHSLLVANIAAGFFDDRQLKDDAFSAGLLHDIGKLVLAVELPDHVAQVVQLVRAEGVSMHDAELRLFGATHAEVGGYLLGLWGLPYTMVEAAANHHAPERVECRGLELVSAVRIADVLANQQLLPVMAGSAAEGPEVLVPLLERIGESGGLDRWVQAAKAHGDRMKQNEA